MHTKVKSQRNLTLHHSPKGGVYKRFLKRSMDFVLSLIAIIVLSPILIIIVFLIRVKLGSLVIFKQKRPGLNEKIFTIYKFRTMSNEKDKAGNLLSDEERLTSFGKILRKFSMDELPELLNVLKGDMSLVGPRPLRIKYLDRYTPEQARRHEVRPGITGLAQVKGRNLLTWEERFKMDVWYVDNWSLFLDIKILFLTFFKVLKREGISAEKHVTMPEFKGTQRNIDA